MNNSLSFDIDDILADGLNWNLVENKIPKKLNDYGSVDNFEYENWHKIYVNMTYITFCPTGKEFIYDKGQYQFDIINFPTFNNMDGDGLKRIARSE